VPLTTILSIFSTSAIVAAGIFAGVQLRLYNKQRARESALQLVHSFRTPEFLRAVNMVFDLPEGLSKKELEDRLGDKNLGILVFRREVDIQLVEDFFSGVIMLSGKKLNRYLVEVRAAGNRQTYYEWFQWLYEQLEKRELKSPPVPSYVAFRDWKA